PLADGAARGDVHHGRSDALDHGRERRHRCFAYRGRQGGVGREAEGACDRNQRETQVFETFGHDDEDTQTMIKFLLWLLLLVVCWPLAILALVLWPIVWLVSIPFRILGIAVDGVFALLRAMVTLPARILGGSTAR